MTQSQIIHEDDECVAIHLPGRSNFTLITFGGLSDRPKGVWFWGRDVAEKLGYDSIGILAKSAHWYPRRAIERLVPAISSYAQACKLGYGFSMGAFGALKHGRLLGLTHVLALSPVNFRLRKLLWQEDFSPEKNPELVISCQETAPINVLIVDPFFLEDRQHAELFSSSGSIQTIKTPFVDHGTIALIRGSANVERMINFLLNSDVVSMSGVLNSNRRRAPDRASNLARASLARGNVLRASKLWQKALETGFHSNIIEHARISGLIEQGHRTLAEYSERRINDIETLIEKISQQSPNSLRLQQALAQWCEIYSAPKAALAPLRCALEIAPKALGGWLSLGRTLHATGKTEEALHTLYDALSVFGESKALVSLMNHLKTVSKK